MSLIINMLSHYGFKNGFQLWVKTTTKGIPHSGKRQRGRRRKGWNDEFNAYRLDWTPITADGDKWKEE